MAMSYNSLVAPKGTTGSLANWVGYSDSKLDLPTIVDEAQALLYEILRVREMHSEWTFGMIAGQVYQSLPSRFLDPIGRVFDLTNNTQYTHIIQSRVLEQRSYDSSISGTFGTNPFTTTAGSSTVKVTQAAHGLNQGSTLTTPSTTPAVNGITLAGTFPVTSIIDANNYNINTGNGDVLASASGAGGGAGITFTATNLISGFASGFGIWGTSIHFDLAFAQAAACKLLYYRQPAMLGSSNQTNFLTDRYPKLLRTACMAACADFMKDDGEYQKNLSALNNLIQTTAAADDMMYRGADFGTDTPYGR